jgi:hypothetical protein
MKIRMKKEVSVAGYTYKVGEELSVVLINSSSEGCKFASKYWPVKFFWFDEFCFV